MMVFQIIRFYIFNVWGANQGNWNKEPGQLPSGSGHAAVIGV